jgi:hypothetical protein
MGNDKKNQDSFGKWIKKGIKKIISLTLGESEIAFSQHKQGDLFFDEEFMEVLEVDFDTNNVPRPKVFKLNLMVTSFFNRIKKNLRGINAIYMVYHDDVVMQFDSFTQIWEDRLIDALTEEYKIDLKRIHFIRESDILNIYNSDSIKRRLKSQVEYFKNPYNLKKHEFIIIAGGFINFKYNLPPLLKELKGSLTNYKAKDTIATIEVEFFVVKNEIETEKISLKGDYPVKYDQDVGAYFYIGGEWYHNIFVPELYNREESRYICFRIDDDGKYIRFFPDSKKRHIPICVKKPEKEQGDGFVRLTYAINPDYISISNIMDFKISLQYESDEEIIVEAEPGAKEDKKETSIETLSFEQLNKELEMLQEFDEKDKSEKKEHDADKSLKRVDQDALPYLVIEKTLLPRPGTGEGDIPSYMMNIGDKENTLQFYVSGVDREISILSPKKGEPVFKKEMDDRVSYKVKLGNHHYSISNRFMEKIKDDEIKLYFAWILESTIVEKRILKSDFYIIGRDPLELGTDQVIPLNKFDDNFWRIGTSRNHAALVKKKEGHFIYNISTANSIYVIKCEELQKSEIVPIKIKPVASGQKLLEKFLGELEKGIRGQVLDQLDKFAQSNKLENNDLVIIGNKAFRYIIPMVIESQLRGSIQNTLRTVQAKKTIN